MSRDHVLQHPDEYRDDLNPDHTAGQNEGPPMHRVRLAVDIKEFHERFPMLDNAHLKQIPILEEGERLEQGAVYLDLRHPERGDFKALGSMSAGPQNWYVAKSSVDYEMWNLLRGETDEYRLGDRINDAPAKPTQTG